MERGKCEEAVLYAMIKFVEKWGLGIIVMKSFVINLKIFVYNELIVPHISATTTSIVIIVWTWVEAMQECIFFI